MVFTSRLTALAVLLSGAIVVALPSAPKAEDLQGPFPAVAPNPELFEHLFAGPPSPPPEVVILSPGDLASATKLPPSPPSSPLRARDVIGAENRVLLNSVNRPYTAMGKVVFKDGDQTLLCSASLVGPRHITTARHCTVKSGWITTMRFMPDYYNTARFGSARIIGLTSPGGSTSDPCGFRDDWAILLLDTRMGDTQGWLGTDVINHSTQLNKPLFKSFGYPLSLGGGERPYLQVNVTARAESCDAAIDTDADSSSGNSGGPLWIDRADGPFQYGLLSAGTSTSTLFAGGAAWHSSIVDYLQRFP